MPTSHFVLSGHSLCMACQSRDVTGQSSAVVHWTKEGESLTQTTQQRIASNGSLCIENATMEAEGNYTCYMFGEPYPHQLSVVGKRKTTTFRTISHYNTNVLPFL